MNLLVTGTDTHVGKTYVTCGLARWLLAQGYDIAVMKPICTGDDGDVQALTVAASSIEPVHLINPVWFRTPAAPYTASMIENRPIDLSSVRSAFRKLSQRHAHVLVEGAGGLLVPIQRDYDYRDLAQDLELAIVVVAANRLGALNHVRLTVEAACSRGLNCRLVVLNTLETAADVATTTNSSILQDLLETPVIGVEKGQSDFEALARALGFTDRDNR
jgi:dethiobiotin synthetase